MSLSFPTGAFPRGSYQCPTSRRGHYGDGWMGVFSPLSPLSITMCQGWPASSFYLKIGRGGGEVEGGRVSKEYLASCPPSPPTFNLNLRICLRLSLFQPSKKYLKSEVKRWPNDVVKYFRCDNSSKARKGRKLIIGAKSMFCSVLGTRFLGPGYHKAGPETLKAASTRSLPGPVTSHVFVSSCVPFGTVIQLALGQVPREADSARGRLAGVALRNSTGKGVREEEVGGGGS